MSDIYKDRENFVRYMSLIYRHQSSIIATKLKDGGINEITSMILICVYRNPGNTQNEISLKCALDKSIVSKKITEFEKSGYLTRKINENNRKYYHIYITELGTELINKSLQIQRNIWDNLFDSKNITDEEIAISANLIKKLAEIMIGKD